MRNPARTYWNPRGWQRRSLWRWIRGHGRQGFRLLVEDRFRIHFAVAGSPFGHRARNDFPSVDFTYGSSRRRIQDSPIDSRQKTSPSRRSNSQETEELERLIEDAPLARKEIAKRQQQDLVIRAPSPPACGISRQPFRQRYDANVAAIPASAAKVCAPSSRRQAQDLALSPFFWLSYL